MSKSYTEALIDKVHIERMVLESGTLHNRQFRPSSTQTKTHPIAMEGLENDELVRASPSVIPRPRPKLSMVRRIITSRPFLVGQVVNKTRCRSSHTKFAVAEKDGDGPGGLLEVACNGPVEGEVLSVFSPSAQLAVG